MMRRYRMLVLPTASWDFGGSHRPRRTIYVMWPGPVLAEPGP